MEEHVSRLRIVRVVFLALALSANLTIAGAPNVAFAATCQGKASVNHSVSTGKIWGTATVDNGFNCSPPRFDRACVQLYYTSPIGGRPVTDPVCRSIANNVLYVFHTSKVNCWVGFYWSGTFVYKNGKQIAFYSSPLYDATPCAT
jgi:hypothetical protein